MEIWQNITDTITSLGLLVAISVYIVYRKQLNLSAITKCIDEFRKLDDLNKTMSGGKTINRYIDLVNEELFYFQHKYIPKEVAKEWIDGMIDYVPITNKKMQILNQENCIDYFAMNRNELLKNFPRIQNAFEVNSNYDYTLIYSKDEKQRIQRVKQREKLIAEILKNIKRFDMYD